MAAEMVRGAIIMTMLALLAGCDMPRDPGETTDSIQQRGAIRLGLAAPLSPDSEQQVRAAAKDLQVRLDIVPGEGEALLRKLEEGELDIVHGTFASNSPWSANVHLGKVAGRRAQPASDEAAPRFAYRNGENGWIMAMEKARP